MVSPSARPGRLHVGTSGWHYAHWRGPFYPTELPPSRWFEHYVGIFSTVELNNSFYRLPSVETFREWAARAPRDFVFAVKASRFITHQKKLNLDAAGLERFFESVEGLGAHLGPILFQLPPRWHLNLDRLAGFLGELPRGHRYAFEFRDPTWHVPEVTRLLERHGGAFCTYELAGFVSKFVRTTDWIYVRLHGPGEKYEGKYDAATLKSWARRLRRWRAEGSDVFVYFDNDQLGYAAADALELARRVKVAGGGGHEHEGSPGKEPPRRTGWPALR